MRVCVCVRVYITHGAISTKFCTNVPYNLGTGDGMGWNFKNMPKQTLLALIKVLLLH